LGSRRTTASGELGRSGELLAVECSWPSGIVKNIFQATISNGLGVVVFLGRLMLHHTTTMETTNEMLGKLLSQVRLVILFIFGKRRIS
jgi:hypothetical protein